jgi:hypothetical protein
MKTLKFNIGTGVLNIINCVLFTVSWPIIFGTTTSDPLADTNLTNGVGAFFYFIASIGIIINIIAMIKSKNNNISIAGPVLGIIGNVLFLLSAALAFTRNYNFNNRYNIHFFTSSCKW